jgi:peptide/nickel transport system substrate-binding protein
MFSKTHTHTGSVTSNGFNRRQILKALGIGAAGLAGAGSLSGLLPRPARAGEGGTMTWGKPLETKEFDPHISFLGSSWQLQHLIYDSLTDMDDNLNPIPSLAESWEQASPTSYIFHLREGATFSNGRPMTADDVVGSLNRLYTAEWAYWPLAVGPMKAITKLSDSSIRFDLERPHTPILDALSATLASIMPMKEIEAGEMDPSSAMLGTGPFMIESHVQDDHWVLKRNPYYWREGLPIVDEVIVRVIPTDQGLMAALRDGSIDIASFEASPDAPLLLSSIPNVEVAIEDVTNFFFLALNGVWEESPFSNLKLRQAVAKCIDRSQIQNFALGGVGDFSSVMAPAHQKCDTSQLPNFAKDIDAAKKLVQEAGADGLTFELLVRSLPADVQMAQVVKQNVAAIGLNAEISVVEEGIWVKRAWVDNPSIFQAMISWYAGYSDPSLTPMWWNPGVAGFTKGHVENDEQLNTFLEQSQSLPHGAERDTALQQLCTRVDHLAHKIPLVTRKDTIAYRSDKLNAKIDHVEGYVNTLRGIEEFTLVSG